MSNYDPNTTPIGQPPQGPPDTGRPGYPGQPSQPPGQKSTTWIWVLGGCGTVILIGVVAFAIIGYLAYRKGQQVVNDMERNPAMAAAKLAVAMNPDLETVSTDEAKGTITIKDRTTGKIVTVDFEAVKDGKVVFKGEGDENVTIEAKGSEGSGSFEVKTDKGSMKFGVGSAAENLPDWVPTYPGAKTEGTYSVRGKDGSGGSFAFTTTDSVDQVISYYETELRGEELKVSVTTSKANGLLAGGVVTGEDKSNHRTAIIAVAAKPDGTQVSVTFTTKD
jgi:hypothetical protein